jgi:pyrroloquinoline quinone (PQQ) biosynthesis protein C
MTDHLTNMLELATLRRHPSRKDERFAGAGGTAFSELQDAWRVLEQRFMDSPPMRRLARGDLSLTHYASYLRETYFYTREAPQVQAVCTAQFRGADRELVKPFLQHATSEIGHDQLALNDLRSLGFDVVDIPLENPLPMTTALFAFPFYAIQYRSAISYLGYLYFLEFLPTSRGAEIAAALSSVGIPAESMTFLREHQTVDTHHNRLMERYAGEMLRTAADVAEVIHSMEVTGRLFEGMLAGAFDAIDQGLVRFKGAKSQQGEPEVAI